MGRHRSRSLAAILVFLGISGAFVRPAAADGFVYVAIAPDTACTEPAEVLVFDAETSALVIRLPLSLHFNPTGITMSDDGRHLFVSGAAGMCGGVASTVIYRIDATQHAMAESSALNIADPGALAANADGSRLFLLSHSSLGSRLHVIDRASGSFTAVAQVAPGDTSGGRAIAYSRSLNRVFVLGNAVNAYNAATLELVGSTTVAEARFPAGMSLSHDEQRLHVLLSSIMGSGTSGDGRRLVLDPLTLTTLSSRGLGPQSQAVGDPVESTGTGELLAIGGFLETLRQFPLTAPGMTSVGLPGDGAAIAVPRDGVLAYVLTHPTPSTPSRGIDALAVVDVSRDELVKTIPLRGGTKASTGARQLTSTAAGACRYRIGSRYVSFPQSGGVQPIRLTTTCDWHTQSDAAWVRVSVAVGSGTATIDLTADPNALSTSRTATLTIGSRLVTVTQAGSISQSPFGVVDTPQNGATNITGSLVVTGWALDDVGVARVRILRDPVAGEGDSLVYLGDATFVEGARPDVQAYLPSAPFATRAGWGLTVLTNMLPNGGNGMFRLHAYAEDIEGRQALLGSRTILCENASAVLPFGTIDTPGQGETVSGTVLNWGWALTPGTATIPADGSTIEVLIDNVVVGRPTRFGLDRADIAALFPGYTNTNSAVGYYALDTTTLSNGIHTIAWVVRDDMGRAQGIGSRYFFVQNP
jgi:hypothetical protein